MARPKGALNKRTRAALSAAVEGKLSEKGEKTIEYLLQVANDERQEPQIRLQAANAALPYCKPRLASIEQTHVDPRDKKTPEEIKAAFAASMAEKPEDFLSLVRMALEVAPEFRPRLMAMLNETLPLGENPSGNVVAIAR